MRRAALIVLPASIIIAAGALVTAGPLNPPAGPVAPSYKTLAEVDPGTSVQSLAGAPPYFINQPGSYYLSANISAVSGQRGIVIVADNVTLDLRGFSMLGNGNGDDAIYCDSRRNITIRNGTIRNWVKEGIDGYQASDVRVERLTVDTCLAGFGIILGDNAMLTDCISTNTGAGFILANKGTLTRCTAAGNPGPGFIAGQASSLSQCTADANTADGFNIALGGTISNCIAKSNGANGFVVDGWGTLDGSTAVGNAQYGVNITAGGGATIGAMVTNCNISANAWGGLAHNGSGATIRGCVVSFNTGGGLALGSNCQVTDNNLSQNGSLAGDPPPAYQIYTGGNGNRFDNNHFYSASGIAGLWVVGIDNMIVRNTFAGPGGSVNATPNNELALIQVAPGQNFTNTNAWANFKY